MSDSKFQKIIAKNKRATFDYDIEKRVIAGVVLRGHEAKSIRSGNVSLKNSFASVKDGELWLNNVHVGQYDKSSLSVYEPTRSRKLLVHKNELNQLLGAKSAGQTIVVLAIGASGKFIKVEIGIGRGKKKHDKRQVLKKRASDRAIQQKLKTRR